MGRDIAEAYRTNSIHTLVNRREESEPTFILPFQRSRSRARGINIHTCVEVHESKIHFNGKRSLLTI